MVSFSYAKNLVLPLLKFPIRQFKMSTKKDNHQIVEQNQKSTSVRKNTGFLSWFVLFTCIILSPILAYLIYSSIWLDKMSTLANVSMFSLRNEEIIHPSNATLIQKTEKTDQCEGKYIFIQDIPSQFNYDLIENCSTLNKWDSMCESLENSGLGPILNNSDHDVFPGSSWFGTNQFTLEVIFHNRMKNYRCLTNNSSKASIIFVPFYAGLDLGRFLWSGTVEMRDLASLQLINYLKKKPEWGKMGGRDHFFVAGRVSWDFTRQTNKESDWGNRLFLLPEVKNMTRLVIEINPWGEKGFNFAIPYPTLFHPSNDNEIGSWLQRMRQQKRPYLFSFAGAPRPQQEGSIRNGIINQCLASKARNCKFLSCAMKKCDHPEGLMRLFQSSVFCLQPPGDSFTRKSAFDAIIAGCIPVFFHSASAYDQYLWHLSKNYTTYSVFISMEDVKGGNVSIEKRLLEIPKEKVVAMREEVIRLIPKVVYASTNSTLEIFEDAFDVAVKEVLNRVEMIRVHNMSETSK